MSRKEWHLTIKRISNGFLLTDEDETLESFKDVYVEDAIGLLYEIIKKTDTYDVKSIKIEVV
ncbi:MAG: hypothetical protein E6L03_10450 [Thaumarchaeota archaeon]|nr:MAG: hypothetical protein E6L03_10450 [Nitrososphaerota archaeon]